MLKRLFQAPTTSGPKAVRALEAQALINDRKPFLLDVREPHEFSGGHIAGAKLIPLGEVLGRLNELPREQPILCICRSGSRSGMAARQLSAQGFETINLSGGMVGWQSAGLPVKRGSK